MDEQNKSVNERWAPGIPPSERGYAAEAGSATREYASDRRYHDEPRGEGEPDRRTTAIRSDIENTRAEMSETIDAIQDRLRPRNVVSRAAEGVRDTAVDKVKQVATRVQETLPVRRSGSDFRGGFTDRVRENPVPAAIAAGSLAWLVFAETRGSSRDASTRLYESADRTNLRVGSRGRTLEGDERANVYPATGDRVRRVVDDTRRRARSMTGSNPLGVAGLAAVLGVAVGMLTPVSERENELMGEARDSVVDRAREAARDAAERVQGVAEDVQRVASKAVSAIGDPDGGTIRGADNP
jgi:hypothetical protein